MKEREARERDWRLFETIDREAQRACRRRRLPDDFAGRIAPRIFENLREKRRRGLVPDGEILRVVEHESARLGANAARVERAARARAVDRQGDLRPVLERRTNVPKLCPRLVATASEHPQPERFLRALLDAARYVAAEMLDEGRRLRAFELAYSGNRSCAEIAELLGTTQEAARHCIRRVADAVETRLLQELRDLAPDADALDRERVLRFLIT